MFLSSGGLLLSFESLFLFAKLLLLLFSRRASVALGVTTNTFAIATRVRGNDAVAIVAGTVRTRRHWDSVAFNTHGEEQSFFNFNVLSRRHGDRKSVV